jgi:hypothetical protein
MSYAVYPKDAGRKCWGVLLGDQTLILPAHGAGSACGGNISERDDTTLGIEKKTNPIFGKSRKEFVDLKLKEKPPRAPYFKHGGGQSSRRQAPDGRQPPVCRGGARSVCQVLTWGHRGGRADSGRRNRPTGEQDSLRARNDLMDDREALSSCICLIFPAPR